MSADGSNFTVADLSDGVSRLGVNDDYSFDTVTTAYRSEYYKSKRLDKNGVVKMLAPTKHGVTSLASPYVQDLWRNAESLARISVQLLLLSGTDFYKKVSSHLFRSEVAYCYVPHEPVLGSGRLCLPNVRY